MVSEMLDQHNRRKDGVYETMVTGYWSNFSRNENERLFALAQEIGTRAAVERSMPDFVDIIFSPKRAAGLGLLDLTGKERVVDFGCMWGALSIPLAKCCSYVLGIDQTIDSLRFLDLRRREERLKNLDLLCADIRHIHGLDHQFDVAVVNGVLEWIPEQGDIELSRYQDSYEQKSISENPGQMQIEFLRQVAGSLRDEGRIYLAIENRYEMAMFKGIPDPHTNLRYVTIAPRWLANCISQLKLGRPYVTWLYSFPGIRRLLNRAGFREVQLYKCYPDYRFPQSILSYGRHGKDFKNFISQGEMPRNHGIKGVVKSMGSAVLGDNPFAPSIVAVGVR